MENKVNLRYGDVLFSALHPPTETASEEQGNFFSVSVLIVPLWPFYIHISSTVQYVTVS